LRFAPESRPHRAIVDDKAIVAIRDDGDDVVLLVQRAAGLAGRERIKGLSGLFTPLSAAILALRTTTRFPL
jgi:hypothetical protein